MRTRTAGPLKPLGKSLVRARRRRVEKVWRPSVARLIDNGNVIEISIAAPLRSPNRLVGRHWTAKQRVKKFWLREVEAALADLLPVLRRVLPSTSSLPGCSGPPAGPAAVEVERYYSSPRYRMDVDNLGSAPKYLYDALVRVGLLRDDGTDWCQLVRPVQECTPGRPAWTVVRVRPGILPGVTA